MTEIWNSFTRYSNGLEVAQMLLAFVGLCFSFWALLDAVKDGMALRSSGANGPRTIIANGNVWTEIERLIKHGICFLIGFASVFLPPPLSQGAAVPAPELLQHTLTRIGLMVITLILFEGALRMRHERRLFVRKMSGISSRPITRAELAPPPGTGAYTDYAELQDPRYLRKDGLAGPKRENES